MSTDRRILSYLIAGLAAWRLIYINFVPLVPQEAYYWKYAKHLALSYFDHPPMAAYTIALFTYLGGDHPFFVRLGSILFSLGTMILLYTIVEKLFKNSRWALISIVIINCTVLFSIGSTVITPDVPLLFFWTLTVYSLVKLKITGQAKWWYVAGLALGLGLLSKYTAILIVPGIFFYLLFSASQRKWLLTVHPYIALIVAFLVFSPVLIWNYQHEWASFMFQSSRRFSEMNRLRLDFFFQLLGSQLGMLTPYVFFLVIIGWLRIGWLGFKERNESYLLLFWIAAPVFFVFTVSSLRSLVKMNWMAPAYVTSIIASVVWLYERDSRWALRFRKWLKPGLSLGLIIVLIMHLLPVFPLIPIRRGDTWTGWTQLAERVLMIKKQMGEDNVFVFGHEYKIPSEITFYTPNHLTTHAGEIIGEKGLQYTYWTDISALLHKNAIFVTSNADRYRKIENLKKYFDHVEAEPPLKIIHHNKVFRIFYLYRCYDYKGTGDF